MGNIRSTSGKLTAYSSVEYVSPVTFKNFSFCPHRVLEDTQFLILPTQSTRGYTISHSAHTEYSRTHNFLRVTITVKND